MTMVSRIANDIFYILLTFMFGNCQNEQIFKLSINEELPNGSIIGNVQNFISNNFYEVSTYEVTFVSKHFTIAPNKDVLINKVVDLEKICDEENLCCTESSCLIEDVAYVSMDSTRKHTFKIEIEIKDINDNKPIFKNPTQYINVKENSELNTNYLLESANDIDISPINKVQSYNFEEPTNTFQLDSKNHEALKLVLLHPIDYEKKKIYKATLLACEKENNCTKQTVIINIKDTNDNFPKFEKSKYQIKIQEDFTVRSVILQVRAIDIDGPEFNKTIYRIENTNDRSIHNYFKIVAENGNIILRKRLSASTKTNYRFKVSATDANLASVGENIDYADVIIDIIDINDHKPKIEVVQSDKLSESGIVIKIKIKENEPKQKLIVMKVSDEDLDNNGKVDCELKDTNSPLELKFISPDFYELWNLKPFDYETNPVIEALFECKDKGLQPLVTYRRIEIVIEDVNEFPPVFQKLIYDASLKENTHPGVLVTSVSAIDKDGSASLRYSIEDNSILKYFSIDNLSGEIRTASISFDREMTDYKEFYVNVYDDKDHPKSAQALVKVEIRDVNDNDPIFILSSLEFFVLENKPPRTKLDGRLSATDRDKDNDNSFISFELVRLYDYNFNKCDRPMFAIKITGDIETLDSLDRESNPNYTITVKAQDRGIPPRFTIANATIHVRDVNDNAPQWQYPRPIDNNMYNKQYPPTIPMLNISENTDKMTLILKLKAYDKDDSDAGRVTYILQNHNEEMFSINATTGELLTITSPLRHGQYKLQLLAKDNGNPPIESEAWILINVLDSGKLANINLTIIIGMIAITVLISVFLIVAIICVRRRPQLQKYLQPSNDVAIEPNQYYSQNHWMYHSEDNPMPPLSDNESFVFLPQSYCTNNNNNHTDGLAVQTINGSRPGSRMEYPLALPSSNNFNNIDTVNGLQMNTNIERINGTLRSNNGFYGTGMPTSMGIVISGQELDGDSADSGKGASEVDLRLQHQLNLGNRNYTTMPFLHYSTATTSFGHYNNNNVSPNQYYSINTNPRGLDSRFLTVNTHLPISGRRVASPNSNCQCFILPEDDVIQLNQPDAGYSMSTFSNKSKLTNHDKNCIYNGGDDIASSGGHFYTDYPYAGETTATMKDYVVIESNDLSSETRDVDKSYTNITDNPHNKNLFQTSDNSNTEKNFYSIGLAN